MVYGVNHDTLTADDVVVSNASCTTNCLSPVAMVLHQEFGIEKGYMTTVHSYTGDQPTLDTAHKDLHRARAAALSMIPTSTGAAKAVGLVLPELAGKLNGSSIRVPTPNVSCVDLKFLAKRDTTAEEVNAALKSASNQALKGILDYCDEPLVSSDFNHDEHSSNIAALETQVTEGNFVRVLAWYDNEWGFSLPHARHGRGDGKTSLEEIGWGGRIRTCEWRHQKALPYHLATPQQARIANGNTECHRRFL